MGIYLNPDNTDFKKSLNSEIYVDKTELIKHTNRVINTEQQFISVSRPRRFGKSMAANMLAEVVTLKKCSVNIKYRPIRPLKSI